MTWLDAITGLLALYGAGLSTYIQAQTQRDKRRTLKVTLATGAGRLPTFGEEVVFMISFVNHGERRVTVVGGGLAVLRSKANVPIMEPQGTVTLPCTLEDGGSGTLFLHAERTRVALAQMGTTGKRKLVAYIRDSTGGEHRSAPIRFDVSRPSSI